MINSAYLNIIRPKNLVIVALCQVVLYYFVIQKYLVQPALDIIMFSLLVLDTVIIAAAGYVINDIKDYDSDKVNKPNSTFIPQQIRPKKAWLYYWVLVVAGAVIALFIAISIHNFSLFFIYPLAVVLLYSYSVYFKSSVLTGNVIVSLFVSLVAGIVFFAERQTIVSAPSVIKYFLIEILSVYMIFSFMINMIREIIKDIEDVSGDNLYGIRTIATVVGISKSKQIALAFTIMTMVIVVLWLMLSPIHFDFRFVVFIILFIVLPLLLVAQIILKHSEKRNFTKISKILKTIMLVGLLSLVFLTNSTQIL